MRVLFVYKDYAPVVGGIENHLRLLAEGLRTRGIETHVLVTNTGARTKQELLGGVPVIKAGRLLTVSSAPVSIALYSHLAQLSAEFDIVHVHSPCPPAEVGCLLLGRIRRFVLTYHSDIVRQKVLGWFYRPILRSVLDRADLITVSNSRYITTSPFLRRVAAKCRVIPHGIDLGRFALTPAVGSRVADIRLRHTGRRLVLFVGRLRHYKGLDVLLAAMQQVAAHLLVVGSGPMEAAWRRQAERDGLMGQVTFLGQVSDEELVALYHAADVLVLPSTNRAESWGTVLVEAMACGLPVVSTELGTGTSIVNQDGVTGLVVPPCDANALAAALRGLLDDEARRKELAAAAHARAVGEFSKEVMLDRVIEFYREAAARPLSG